LFVENRSITTLLQTSVQAAHPTHSVHTMNNSTDEFEFIADEHFKNASRASSSRWQLARLSYPSLIVGLAIGLTGTCANGVVFGVLMVARRRHGTSVNVMIINQSLMDFAACVFLIIAVCLSFDGTPSSYPWLGDLGNYLVCTLFLKRTMVIVCSNAEKIGLVVITLERYFKIVHAIAHRNFYRNWMTKVGVAFPWISGLAVLIIPASVSRVTVAMSGRCPRAVWPSQQSRIVSQFFYHHLHLHKNIPECIQRVQLYVSL